MTAQFPPKRLILFDIDGTLLRTQGAGRATTGAAMLEVFGTASTVETHYFGGKTDWSTLIQLLSDHGYTAETIGQKMPDFVEAMGRHMSINIKQYPSYALPGALEAVQRVRDDPHSIVGLVTGNAPTSARIKLEASGFRWDWFKVGAFGSEAIDRNELPRLAIERAQAFCGCDIVPENIFIIGDTLMDIRAARAVGAVAIAVRCGFEDTEALAAAKPDYLLDDLSTLFDVL